MPSHSCWLRVGQQHNVVSDVEQPHVVWHVEQSHVVSDVEQLMHSSCTTVPCRIWYRKVLCKLWFRTLPRSLLCRTIPCSMKNLSTMAKVRFFICPKGTLLFTTWVCFQPTRFYKTRSQKCLQFKFLVKAKYPCKLQGDEWDPYKQVQSCTTGKKVFSPSMIKITFRHFVLPLPMSSCGLSFLSSRVKRLLCPGACEKHLMIKASLRLL